jgi:hypothetical protein
LIAALASSLAPARGADAPAIPAQPPGLAQSAATAVARMSAVPAAALEQDAATTDTPAEQKGLLKSRRGRIAAVLFVAGVVITAVSRSKDAVESPAR